MSVKDDAKHHACEVMDRLEHMVELHLATAALRQGEPPLCQSITSFNSYEPPAVDGCQ